MSNSYPQSISGRIKTVAPVNADTNRYSFVNLQNTEPNLGLPIAVYNSQARFLLASDTITGTRYWTNSANFAIWNDNIGVGTETPPEKLTVVGNLSVTGNIYGNVSALSGQSPIAAGKTSQVQFNSGGFLGAEPGFTYSTANSAITVGFNNTSTGQYGGILGGANNVASSPGAMVVGGSSNVINNQYGVIVGGTQNTIASDYSVINGGLGNYTYSTYAAIVGGNYNKARGYANLVAGGVLNDANGLYSAILGGYNNAILDDYAAILGGQNNIAQKKNVFILGSNLTAITGNYTYVNNISSQGQLVAQQVGIGINNSGSSNALTVVGNISSSGTIYGTFQASSGLAAGDNQMVQYNNGGVFGGDKGFTYNQPTSTISAKTLNTTTLGFSALSANQVLLTSSITATSAFFTIFIGSSSFAIPLYRY